MVNEKQKYPNDKRRYDKNYLGLYGKICSNCEGKGFVVVYLSKLKNEDIVVNCPKCDGLGYIEKEKK